jgi:uncharacterized protein (DUF1501 family)
MDITRRALLQGGAATVAVGFGVPGFLCDLALAQGATGRNLVVLYLAGGNDSLSMLVPYGDPSYASRRPTLAVPAGQVLQVGRDSSGKALGLHPRLSGLKSIFDQGRLALIQRVGYENSSRSHFLGTDIWATANPVAPQGPGWLGRYLDTLAAPLDPLVAWNTMSETPHALQARSVDVPAIPSAQGYVFASPNTGAEAQTERAAAVRMSSHPPVAAPHIAFVSATAQKALATIDRVAAVAQYAPTVVYPSSGFGQVLRMVAGALVKGIGTRVFWVQTGGFDTHSQQGTNVGTYANLMTTLNDGLTAFYADLNNQRLLSQTLVLQFSEFGRRITENGSQGTDHGAASVMMALGGSVRGGLYGTAPSLQPDAQNGTLENGGNDVRYETDFRSVYARAIDNWLGADSVSLLGANFRTPGLDFV